jgi:ATP-dependent DNA ligase
MALPLSPPVLPQLAKPAAALPDGEGWSYEPKLDGFRTIVFVDGDEQNLQSRNGRPMDRYFPEIDFPPGRYVLDGELVLTGADGGDDFEALQQRIHPAASRIRMLAEETPARFVAFDLLAEDDETLLGVPFTERRARLERLAGKGPGIEVIDRTSDAREASSWLGTREGVIAKQDDATYRPGERTGMVKVRRVRTVDAVVIGWREHKHGGAVGSLILGMYEPDGTMRHVGHTAGFTVKRARELVDVVRPLETGEFGEPGPSRWSSGRDTVWHDLRPELVAEVEIEHVSGGRIRHGARFQRWRDDKAPEECTTDQLDR